MGWAMNPRIELLPETRLIGKRIPMTLAVNKTAELWKSFMPRRKEIPNRIGAELYSLQIYEPLFFDNFNPNGRFEKWACVEVTDFEIVPDGLEAFILSGGLYAVFLYRGAASAAAETFQYIFGTWLPSSEYILDQRPHFERLGEKYKNEDPESEEEIWIPIQPKKGTPASNSC
jgi:AraC family transcriptional regulator